MAQNLYGPRVRIGNWNEDVYLEEEIMKDFLAKRDKGQLLIQRNRRLKENLLRPMQLSVSEDGYIHYGDKVMLVSPDHPETEADLFLRGDLSLCMTPDEIKAHLSNELEVPCGISAAQIKIPNFRLGITGGFDDRMLYLSSDHRTLLKSSKRSWLQEVSLTHEDSYLNCWQAAFPDPQLRLEYEGSPVPVSTAVCADAVKTYFGKEAEVAAHTYLDSHRVEKPKNHWMLVTGAPRKDLSTMLDLPKPPAEDTRALEQ
ncbi:CFAP161, partial [Cervus elaphus hippelaphus]